MKKKCILGICIIAILVIMGVVVFNNKNKKEDISINKEVKQSKYVELKGIYVDKSDKQEHPNEALLYVLYTVKSDDKNIQFYTYMANNPGTALTIKINNMNEYKDTIYSGKLKQNFRDTGYENLNNGQKVLSGTSIQCIGAYRVAQNDLKEGGTIELTLVGTNSFKEVFEYKTEDVKYYDNVETLLKEADPETYDKAKKISEEKLADIDESLRRQIDSVLQENYYYWYISTIKTTIEFYGDHFEISSNGLTNNGTYEIKNKVILLHYNSGMTNQLPYEFKNGEVEITDSPE